MDYLAWIYPDELVLCNIKLEKKEIGEINYIFSDDEYMLNKNIKYLNHDTLTDIITFDYSNGNNLTSDIIISVSPFTDDFDKALGNEIKETFLDIDD